MAKQVNIILYLEDDQEVNDKTVGEALGRAIMSHALVYESASFAEDIEAYFEANPDSEHLLDAHNYCCLFDKE
jgi:hypothetical protein